MTTCAARPVGVGAATARQPTAAAAGKPAFGAAQCLSRPNAAPLAACLSARQCAGRGQELHSVAARRRRARSAQVVRASNDDPDAIDKKLEAAPPSGPPNAMWRVISAMPYLIPLMGAILQGAEAYYAFPLLGIILRLLAPISRLYYEHQFTPFLVFFVMYLTVVRSPKVPHFMRFNAMQAILLDICIMLVGLILQNLPFELFWTFPGAFIQLAAFMAVMTCCLYSVGCCLAGMYADVPIISEAVYIQVQSQ